MIRLKNLLMETQEYRSPSGGKIIFYFETGQGSQYLFTDKGESKRWKTVHANTGPEDQGLKEWYPRCVFVDPKDEHAGNAFLFLKNRNVKNVGLAIKNNQGLFYIHDGNWRAGTWNDAFPNWVKSNPKDAQKPLLFTVSEKPKVGWNTLEFRADSNHILRDVHFGSPVSKLIPIDKINPDQLKNFLQQKS